MADQQKAISTVNATLEAARLWALENISGRYTGTMTIELVFVEGGVRRPSITEQRVLVVKKD
jgi:hypothetical protein